MLQGLYNAQTTLSGNYHLKKLESELARQTNVVER